MNFPVFMQFLHDLGLWMTFKKAEMEKTLRNGLSMSETDLLQQMVRFRHLHCIALHQFQKKTAVKGVCFKGVKLRLVHI